MDKIYTLKYCGVECRVGGDSWGSLFFTKDQLDERLRMLGDFKPPEIEVMEYSEPRKVSVKRVTKWEID